MARILICEPYEDVSALLELVVRRLGHEPVLFEGGDLDRIGVDAAVVEPGDDVALRVARALRIKGVPVLFTSIYPPTDHALALQPVAYLVKPFTIDALERALAEALAPTQYPSAAAAV